MRLSKFLSIVFFITLFCLLYVYQETEIFHLAYAGQKKQALFQELLEKNSILRYNIARNASLVNIGNLALADKAFQMPDSYLLVRLGPSQEGIMQKKQSLKKETILSRLFSVKRQAEATTANH